MQKRNKTLLIILIILIGILVFFWLTRNKPAPAPGDGNITNFWTQFNPFRSSTPSPTIPSSENPAAPSPTGEVPLQNARLLKISSMPIAGYVVYLKERYVEVPAVLPGESTPAGNPAAPPTEFATALRYVARGNGNIYQTFADKIDERKFTTTVIPKVYEAVFGKEGTEVVMRHLKTDGRTIETFTGSLPKEVLGGDTSGGEIVGSFLPDGITDLSVSSDGTRMFYLYNQGENTLGATAVIPGGAPNSVFSSPFNEWLSAWGGNKILTLTTKPAAVVPGYLYVLNSETKALTRELGGINGLTALPSPDGKKILYADSSLNLNIYDLATKTSSALGARTLPEKCAWSKDALFIYCAVPKFLPGGNMPDDWYQGEVSFSDEIWKIEVSTALGGVIFDPSEEGRTVDGIKLTLDPKSQYLFLANKSDSILWELKLE